MKGFIQFYTYWIAIMIVATMIFLIFPIAYLCNGNKIMPYGLGISYVVIYSVNIFVSIFFVGMVLKNAKESVKTSPLANQVTRRLTIMLFLIYVVDYVFNVASLWGWLDNNAKYKNDPDGQSPFSPSRAQAAFFSLFSYSGGSIYVKIFVVIYALQLFTNLYDIINNDAQVSIANISSIKESTSVPLLAKETKKQNKFPVLFFFIAGFVFFVATLVYVLIFFVVAFKINTAINLVALVSILSVMTGFYIICGGFFFFSTKAHLEAQSDTLDVAEVVRQVSMMFYFFAFYLSINWIFFIDAWVLTGPDSVDFSGRLPHLINTAVSQPLFFYTFVEGMAPINAGAVVIIAYYFVTFIYTTYYMMLGSTVLPKWFEIRDSRIQAKIVYMTTAAWVSVAVSWACVIVVFGFIFAAFAGNFYMAVNYRTFIYTFTAVGALAVIGVVGLNFFRVAAHYTDYLSRNRDQTDEKARKEGFFQSFNRSLNAVYIMSLFRTIICVPLYYILAIVVYYISNSQYNLLGSPQVSQWLIRAKLNGPTVEPVTFYWPEIVLVQFVLIINLVIVLIDSTANNTTIIVTKKNK